MSMLSRPIEGRVSLHSIKVILVSDLGEGIQRGWENDKPVPPPLSLIILLRHNRSVWYHPSIVRYYIFYTRFRVEKGVRHQFATNRTTRSILGRETTN